MGVDPDFLIMERPTKEIRFGDSLRSGPPEKARGPGQMWR